MIKKPTIPSINFQNCCVGITGAKGELGSSLTNKLREKGAFVIGLTHSPLTSQKIEAGNGPSKWVEWQCGKEEILKSTLEELDLLILNHGINPQGRQSNEDLNSALEINALSTWRLIELFESICKESSNTREIWVNTSEAEIQPALSPLYEISKRLIGELISLRWNNQTKKERESLKIRKLILGPFKSKLNPVGLMSSNFVANQILLQSKLNFRLIIVSPNPLTYIIMPIVEIIRETYSKLLK